MNRTSHCGRYRFSGLSRRELLKNSACGFGAVALASLMADPRYAGLVADDHRDQRSAFLPQATHFEPKVKRVVYLYMDGGPSQVDTFDPKPQLAAENGQPFKMKIEPTQFNNIGKTLKSPWEFSKHGESGIPISALFPQVAKHADDLAVIRSMTSEFSEHTSANYFLHTGKGFQGRPSMGAWLGYGLGTECQDLPGFIVLNGGLIPPGGLDCFNSGFLPATYQGSIFNSGDNPVANIRPREKTSILQRNKLDLLQQLDAREVHRSGRDNQIESAIANYELAFRMQSVVPQLADLSGETKVIREMYGLDQKHKGTATFGRQCLMARRLLERGGTVH